MEDDQSGQHGLKWSSAQAARVMEEMTDVIAGVIADSLTRQGEASELILIADETDENGAKVGFQMSVGGHIRSGRVAMLKGNNMWAVVSVAEADAIFRAAVGLSAAPLGLPGPGSKPAARGTRVLVVAGGGFFPITLPPLLSPGGAS